MELTTVITVFKSGGDYDQDFVRCLRAQVDRHMSVPHRFVCLSDQFIKGVACHHLQEDWPGWWSKIELFRPGLITGPTLYLDLDTVLVGSIDALAWFDHDFAMMRNVWEPRMPGSAVMWFREKAPAEVWKRFSGAPEAMMEQYKRTQNGAYLGDQAFIWDTLHRKVEYLSDQCPGLIRSYRRHCLPNGGPPEGCSLVAFGGAFKPWTVQDNWVRQAWHSSTSTTTP